MAISQVPPLSYNVPIVYPKGHPSEGCPTPAFQALIQILLEEKAVTDALAEGAAPGTRVITAGTGLTGGGDLTADRTISLDTTAEAERIRDVIGAALVAGSNVTITVDDAGDTITIAASGGGSGSLVPQFVQESSAASSSNVTSFTITFPQATAASGNTAFIVLATDGSQTITAPTGWTVRLNQAAPSFSRLMVLERATAGQTSATFTSGSVTSYAALFFEMSGSHTFDQSSAGATTNASTVALPSITPSSGALVFGFAAEVAFASGGSVTPAAPALSPRWNTVSVGGSSPQQRLLFGHICIALSDGSAIKPPSINNQGQSLFGSGGIAYASFSIL